MRFKTVTIAFSIFCFLFKPTAFAMTEEVIDDLSTNSNTSVPQSNQEEKKAVNYIGSIHDELIFVIIDFLKDDLLSLQALTATNHSYYNLIMSHIPYISPKNQTDVFRSLKETPFDQIHLLSCFWRRGALQDTIKYLQEIKGQYVGYGVSPSCSQQEFRIYLKSLGLLYTFKDQTVKESFKELYEAVQSKLHETIDDSEPEASRIINSGYYIKHYKAFAELNPEIRESLVNSYRKGIEPFPKNEKKAKKFERGYMIPLNSKTVYSN